MSQNCETVISSRRIQRKRTKGFSLANESNNPNGVVCVSRPSKFGNQFRITEDRNREQALQAYTIWFETMATDEFKQSVIGELRGKDLACFCPLHLNCHADLLLQYANHCAEQKK